MIILRLPDNATLMDAIKAFVALQLKLARYNISEAARRGGIVRSTLSGWVKEWGWKNDGYIGPPENAPRAVRHAAASLPAPPAAQTPEPATPAPPPSLLHRPEIYDPETRARAEALLRRKKENGEV